MEPAVEDITPDIRNALNNRGAVRKQDIDDFILLLHRDACVDQPVDRSPDPSAASAEKAAGQEDCGDRAS